MTLNLISIGFGKSNSPRKPLSWQLDMPNNINFEARARDRAREHSQEIRSMKARYLESQRAKILESQKTREIES